MTQTDRWADLQVRITSAAVMIALAVLVVYQGGVAFLIAAMLLIGTMIWELAEMTAHSRGAASVLLGVAAALCLYLWTTTMSPAVGFALMAMPSLGLLLTGRRDRVVLALYALAVMWAGTGFLSLRAQGPGHLVWLALVVVVSDTLGYFVGRMIGGAKFWPKVSPKKTWSGTVAGWIGAGLVGVVFAWAGYPLALVALSPLVAFAGQLGDIAESWIKRRAGVKDSSDLIPGHGGFLDRFDALVGAMLAVQGMLLIFAGLG